MKEKEVETSKVVISSILRGALLTAICLPLCLFVPVALLPTAIIGGLLWAGSTVNTALNARALNHQPTNNYHDEYAGVDTNDIFLPGESAVIDFIREDIPYAFVGTFAAVGSAFKYVFSKKYRQEVKEERANSKQTKIVAEQYSDTNKQTDVKVETKEEEKTKFSSKKQLSTNKNKQQDSCKE